MLKETPLQPAFTAPYVFCSVEMGLHSSLIKPMWQKYFIWTFDKFMTVTYESSLSRVRHSLVYEVDVRPPHLIGRDPQDCDVVVVLWFPWQPVVWPCLQLKGGKGKKCKSRWWICYCSSRTLLPLTKQAELVPPFEPHRQTHILVRCHKHWSCLELLISMGKAKTRVSQRMRGGGAIKLFLLAYRKWQVYFGAGPLRRRDRKQEREQWRSPGSNWLAGPYQIHENVGCHFFVLLVLLRDRQGDRDAAAAADQRLWTAGFVPTRLTSWDRVIPTRTITFSSQ